MLTLPLASRLSACHRHRRPISSAASSSSSSTNNKLSSVHKGTQFEHRARRLLHLHFSMALQRTGGKDDGGIDLQGWWWLPGIFGGEPDSAVRIRVLAQCKAERKKLGPHYIRELEGVFVRYAHLARVVAPVCQIHENSGEEDQEQDGSDAHRNTGTSRSQPLAIAALVSESAFTPASIKCAMSSHVPFLLVHLPATHSEANDTADLSVDESTQPSQQIGGAIWNPALAGRNGVLRGALELRWERALSPSVPGAAALGSGRPAMWWKGERLGCYVPEK